MTDLWRKLGALALLAGLLLQAADGLTAALCHPDMSHGAAEASNVPQGDHHAGSENHGATAPGSPQAPDTHTDGEPCPFGSGVLLACSGAGTAVAPTELIRLPSFPTSLAAAPSTADSTGALLAHETFRPPRA